MEKVTISRIAHFSKDKEGNPLKTKQGKPYTRCLVDLTDGRKVSGFGNVTTSNWNEGDEVEMEITESNGYLNFKTAPAHRGGLSDLDKEALRRIDGNVNVIMQKVVEIYKHLEIDKTPEYPEPEGDVKF
jgi:hypothetical protein